MLLLFYARLICAPVALAKTPAAASAKTVKYGVSSRLDHSTGALSELEEHYLQRSFPSDPFDKRLTRLELLVFGARQPGATSDRIERLKNDVAKKANDKMHAAQAISFKKEELAELTNLEQHILKKSFPRLDSSMRLANLEKKVFGTAFPAVAAKERLDRLKKTTGLGSSDQITENPQNPENIVPFPMPFMSPFAGPGDLSVDPEINRQMAQMFRRLNEQLRELRKNQPPGYMIPPGSLPKNFNGPFGHDNRQAPLQPPGSKNTPNGNESKLPPYLDPNSI